MKRKDKKLKRHWMVHYEESGFERPVGRNTPWVMLVPAHLAEQAEQLTGAKARTVIYPEEGEPYVEGERDV